jgi:hypothetical protein
MGHQARIVMRDALAVDHQDTPGSAPTGDHLARAAVAVGVASEKAISASSALAPSAGAAVAGTLAARASALCGGSG